MTERDRGSQRPDPITEKVTSPAERSITEGFAELRDYPLYRGKMPLLERTVAPEGKIVIGLRRDDFLSPHAQWAYNGVSEEIPREPDGVLYAIAYSDGSQTLVLLEVDSTPIFGILPVFSPAHNIDIRDVRPPKISFFEYDGVDKLVETDLQGNQTITTGENAKPDVFLQNLTERLGMPVGQEAFSAPQ